jgi:hypothetical protein
MRLMSGISVAAYKAQRHGSGGGQRVAKSLKQQA